MQKCQSPFSFLTNKTGEENGLQLGRMNLACRSSFTIRSMCPLVIWVSVGSYTDMLGVGLQRNLVVMVSFRG